MDLAKYIDHTLLKATATDEDIQKLCREAKEHHFFAVCINSCYIPVAKKELKGTEVKIATVVGFPLGANSPESKVRETSIALDHGADEIDMVMNIGFFRSNWHDAVQKEIEEVKRAAGTKNLKVIIETCYLSIPEIETACLLAEKAGAEFVKTSTGFGTGGATLEAVEAMVKAVGNTMKIKASGGIKDAETAMKFIKLGVNRIGTSSGIEIISGAPQSNANEHTY